MSSIENPGWVGRPADNLIVHELGDGVLHLIGEIDMDTSPILRRCLEADPLITVIDLREVTFIDSTGLTVLINAHRDRVHGIILRSPAGAVSRVLELAGVDRYFRIERPEVAAD